MMHQPAVATLNKGVSYAFGWRTNLVEGEPSVRHGGDVSNFHSNMAFLPTRGWGAAIVMNVAGLSQSAALNEPINEVLRLSSGYDAGQPVDDLALVFFVLWGIAILIAVLNLLFWAISYRRQKTMAANFVSGDICFSPLVLISCCCGLCSSGSQAQMILLIRLCLCGYPTPR